MCQYVVSGAFQRQPHIDTRGAFARSGVAEGHGWNDVKWKMDRALADHPIERISFLRCLWLVTVVVLPPLLENGNPAHLSLPWQSLSIPNLWQAQDAESVNCSWNKPSLDTYPPNPSGQDQKERIFLGEKLSSPISMLTKLITPKQLASIDKPSLAIGFWTFSACYAKELRLSSELIQGESLKKHSSQFAWTGFIPFKILFFSYSDSYTTIYYIYFFNYECIYTYFRSWCHLNLKIWAITTSLKLVPRSFPTWRWHPLVCSHPPPQVRFAKLTPIDPSISPCDHSKNIGIHHTSLSWDLSGLDFSLWTTPQKKTLYKLQCTFRSWHMSMIFPRKAVQILLAKEIAGFQDVSVDIPWPKKQQRQRGQVANCLGKYLGQGAR